MFMIGAINSLRINGGLTLTKSRHQNFIFHFTRFHFFVSLLSVFNQLNYA